MKTHNKLFAS